MNNVGTIDTPLRVAIIGAGPAAFYAADSLLKQKDLTVEVDMFDRLPTPFGLVRGGVAPDHQKIKNVNRVYHKTALQAGFRFFGNVDVGKDVTVEELRRHYHQIVYATGAQTDRSLGIPGEDLAGSHSATEFVAWYNGHPDFRHLTFDLSAERVAVVGVGNVAVDVARILCRTPEELAATDIADYALEALRESKVREVYMLGRRGPAQAAFTPPEAKELGEMVAADTIVLPSEAELDAISREELEKGADRDTLRNVEIISAFAANEPTGKPKRLIIRFLVSPVEILGTSDGRVSAIRLVRNKLQRNDKGRIQARPTGKFEELPVQLVFRSVGYRGVPLPGVPFNEDWGVILNEKGRVLDPETRRHVVGEYAAGWIKRGPTGVIGTNKADAVETVACMLEDAAAGILLDPPEPTADAAESTICDRQPRCFTYEDWIRIDEIETSRGQETGRPRVKFTSVEEMWEAVAAVAPRVVGATGSK
jgi:ferredoxin/flavodoxin---NADP+ reductase